jgi:hypothetical protein
MSQDQSRWNALNGNLALLCCAGPDNLCDAIACLYEAIAATPEPLLQDFAGFTEAMLLEGLIERAAEVARGTAQVVVAEDPRATLLDAGRLLRALESNAAELSHFLESDLGEDLEAAWGTSDGRHYVIPRLTPLARIDGKPFLRRALLHFRVLPTRIDAFAVRLHRSPLAASAAWADRERGAPERRYGAALFPGLLAELAYPDADSFTVAGVGGCDAPACIAEHLREARAAECYAIVWGELTMPDANVDLVRESLSAGAIEGRGPLRYLVAGSWHCEIEGQVRNAAQILDGFGEPLFTVLKWAKFTVADKLEAIAPGSEVHVLVGEDELMVVAICRDFLQATTDLPYLRLNVDVAIVPSMIASIDERATLAGHAATANTMRVRYGTRTLVVAQPRGPGAAGVGQVLAFPAKPLETGGEIVAGAWHLCVLANA